MALDTFIHNINDDKSYTVSDFYNVIGDCADLELKSHKHKNEDGEWVVDYVYNVPAAFDIEATSWTRKFGKKKIKYATMFIWQFGINGHVFTGRTWEEFKELIKRLKEFLGLGENTFLNVYVHNLAYDFQFIRKQFDFTQIFALDERRVVKALTSDGIEYRCSYILSGKSLASVGNDLLKIKIKKLVGDLDYKLIRHSQTPLTLDELQYCIHDVKVIMAYIYEKFDRGETIEKILLTKTSYVRQYVREHTIGKKNPNYAKYRKMISKLTLNPSEYKQAKESFSGGFTHANPSFVDRIIENVNSIDFTSSYPAVMLSCKFPMSKGQYIKFPTDKDVKKYIFTDNYLSHFVITFYGLKQKETVPDAIISLSKCYTIDGHYYSENDAIVNNGRIVYADEPVVTTMTNIDLQSVNQFYDYDKIEITELWHYVPGYLPKEFLDCVIHFYKQKTTLKGVTGKEFEYQYFKEMVNACYGMCVTALDRETVIYEENEWQPSQQLDLYELADVIEKYNTSKSRFLSYLWGVYITAYARRNLFTGILSMNNPNTPEKSDYIYSDTDSIKFINLDQHKAYINWYNNWYDSQIQPVCQLYGYTIDDVSPKDKKGIRHPLGHWDLETENDPYIKFKTLGAKRYLTYQKKKGYNMTVAGVPKFSGNYDINDKGEKVPVSTVKSLVEKYENYSKDIFEEFNSDMEITSDNVNKICLTYIDEPFYNEPVTDYLGSTLKVSEQSYIYMENIGYQFSRSDSFANFLLNYIETDL